MAERDPKHVQLKLSIAQRKTWEDPVVRQRRLDGMRRAGMRVGHVKEGSIDEDFDEEASYGL